MTNYVDFHCHLDFKEFDGKRKEIINKCFNSGFSNIVSVADPYEPGSFERTVETLQCHDQVYCMAGGHPHYASKYSNEIEENIIGFITENNAIGYGEAGLDFHYNLSSPDDQRRVFKRQISVAKELKLPLIIHSRNAEKEVMDALEEMKFDHPVVFHCYTGNIEDGEEIIKRGYSISISGIVTFKKSDSLREVVKIIPIDRIFTETDSPYLAPVPFRGETNTPYWVTHVAQKVAELKEISVETLNNQIKRNLEILINYSKKNV